MKLLNDNVVIQQEQQDIKPIALVKSCTECCLERTPDGKPNVLGMLHKALYTKYIVNDNGVLKISPCGYCPITKANYTETAKTEDGKTIYWKGTDVALSEMDRMKLEMDSGNYDLYCDIR